MIKGIVKWFNDSKGWGHIRSLRMNPGSLTPARGGRVGSCLETFKPSCQIA